MKTHLHVSKLGHNSDGSSWAKAFHGIQATPQAIPDAHGGHRIVVRPDTSAEANLYRQPVPAGFERRRFWPVENFKLLPARFARPDPAVARTNMPAR